MGEGCQKDEAAAGVEKEYKVGPGRPPLHTRFKKGRSGNPRGGRPKPLPALLEAALNERVALAIDGRERRVTKREAIIAALVDKSVAADLRAAKLLLELMRRIELEPAEPKRPPLEEADRKVIANLIERFRQEEPPPDG